MKRLTLVQSTVILMVGVPGAGKSFFARQFAESYDLPHISSDRIRFELFNEPQYTNGEQQIVHRMADYMIDEFLQSGTSFIVDGLMGNAKTQRMSIERRARQNGYKVLAIWIQVDTNTARERSLKRRAGKRDDQFNKSLPEGAFTAWCKQLTPLSTEPHVVVSGKHTFPTQRSTVLRKLLPPHPQAESAQQKNDGQGKVIIPTPTRHMGKPADRSENRRIIIS